MIQAFGLTSDHRKDLPPAVDDVSFEAHAGRVTALLGQSGAGKTTTLRLMLELQQGRGITHFKGRPLHHIPHPSHEVGVLLGEVPGHPSRTVRGHLRMLCAAAGVPARRADEVLEVVGLVSLRDERLGSLSRGTDRRLGLACALLADPHTLVLDEPADGISARENRWLHGMLRAHAAQGGTVLYTTADPKEAARTADRVVTLERGRIVADQDAADFGRHRLRPRVAVRSPHATRLAALLTKEARTERRSVEVVREDDNRLYVYGSTCADIGETAFRHGILVHQLADEVGDMGPGAGPAPASAPQTAERPGAPSVPSAAPGKEQASGQPVRAGVGESAAGDRRPADARSPGDERRGGTQRPETAPTSTAFRPVGAPETSAVHPRDGRLSARADSAGGAGRSGREPVPPPADRALGAGRAEDVSVEARAEDADTTARDGEKPERACGVGTRPTAHEGDAQPTADGTGARAAAHRTGAQPRVHGDDALAAAHGDRGATASAAVRRETVAAAVRAADVDAAVTVRPGSGWGADRAGGTPATREPAPASLHALASPALPAHAPGGDARAHGQAAGTAAPGHPSSGNGSGGSDRTGEPDRPHVPPAPARTDLKPPPARADVPVAPARTDLPAGSARAEVQAGSSRADLPAGAARTGLQAAPTRTGPQAAHAHTDLPSTPAGREAPARSAHADALAESARTDLRSTRTDDRQRRMRTDTPASAPAGSLGGGVQTASQRAPQHATAHEAPAQGGAPARPVRHRHLPGTAPSGTAQTSIPTPRPAEAAAWGGSSLPPPIRVRPGAGPLRPLRYELRRAAGVGTGFVTGAAVLALSALTALLLGRIGHTPQARLLAGWPQLLPLPPAALGAGLLGALSFGDEFRHPALAADRGTVPRRLGLLAAKLLVATATALALAFLTIGCDAEVLYVVYGAELTRVPGDWLWLGASWTGLVVGCAWAGVLAAGLFRSTAAGVAAVLAVPVLVLPLLQWALDGAAVTRLASGLPVRLRHVLLLQWPFGGDRYLTAAARLIAQPVGAALTLSLATLACGYLFTVLRSRAR
ncbi:ATP-binding cassette domain-containing protein [Streptomyces sp. NPDC003697]